MIFEILFWQQCMQLKRFPQQLSFSLIKKNDSSSNRPIRIACILQACIQSNWTPWGFKGGCIATGIPVPLSYLPSILLTQPWLTRSCLEMSQGRTPWWASSTILCLTTSGRGLPFTNTPPSWFTPPCPTWDTTAPKKDTRT